MKNSSTAKRPVVALWHPFTAASVGVVEDDLPRIHSKPHVAALRRLAREHGCRCRVEYLSEKSHPYCGTFNDLTWHFWPLSFRTFARCRGYRRQWSLRALTQMAVAPPDVMIINMSGLGSAFARMLARLCRLHGNRYVVIVGRSTEYSPAQILHLQHASSILVHTEHQRLELDNRVEFRGQVVEVLPLGVDTGHFRPPVEPRKPGGGPHLLYVGRVVPGKGALLAVRALAPITARYPGASLKLVGPCCDPAYKEEIRAFAAEQGIEDAVDFVGTVPYADLPALYQDADLLLLPSKSESFGMVVVEAMACGTPVLALQGSGGPDEIITHGVSGVLATPDTLAPEAMRLLDSPCSLRSMSQSAVDMAHSRYSLDATYRVLLRAVCQPEKRSDKRC